MQGYRLIHRVARWLAGRRRRRFGKRGTCDHPTDTLCYRLSGMEVAQVDPADTPPEGAPVLPRRLIVERGTYRVDNRVFRLDAEGVYRFYALGRLSEQRLLWGGDPERLLGLVGWLWSYGNHDDLLAPGALRDEARHRNVEVTCTTATRFCVAMFAELGLNGREVLLLTLDPWNQFDNGHTLLEVCAGPAGWVLYDPSFKCTFRRGGKLLSLLEFVLAVTNDDPYDIVRTDASRRFASYRQRGYDFGFWVEHRMASEQQLRRWYRRVAGVPMIKDSGDFYFTASDAGARDRVLQYPTEYLAAMHHLPMEEFTRRFYGSAQ